MSEDTVTFVNQGGKVFCVFEDRKEEITKNKKKILHIGYAQMVYQSHAYVIVEWLPNTYKQSQYINLLKDKKKDFFIHTADILPFPIRAPRLRAVT